jgi:hypothetical protein
MAFLNQIKTFKYQKAWGTINTHHKRNYDNAGNEKHTVVQVTHNTFLRTTLYTENNFLKKKAVTLYTCCLPAFTHIFSPILHSVCING